MVKIDLLENNDGGSILASSLSYDRKKPYINTKYKKSAGTTMARK